MIRAEVRHHAGMLIEEQEYFHEIPRQGDRIKYPHGRHVEVLYAEHTPYSFEGSYFHHPATVKIIVKWV